MFNMCQLVCVLYACSAKRSSSGTILAHGSRDSWQATHPVSLRFHPRAKLAIKQRADLPTPTGLSLRALWPTSAMFAGRHVNVHNFTVTLQHLNG